jgi:ATP-dependent RNA helicase RhlE
VKDLANASIRAEALHGDKSQEARQRALGNFKTRRTRILVATDIAARGIDIDELAYVINYDMPDTPETYVHRIGRTGRAGATGVAITMVAPDERNDMRGIERVTRISARVMDDHAFAPRDEEWREAAPPPRQQQQRQRRPNPYGSQKQRPQGPPREAQSQRSDNAGSPAGQPRSPQVARPFARPDGQSRDQSSNASGSSSRRQPRRPFGRSR